MSSYENIYEILNGKDGQFIERQLEDLTVDQRIAAANVVALAAIAEELSAIREHGIGQSNSDGATRNRGLLN